MRAVLKRHPLLLILAVALTLRLIAAVGVQSYLDREGRDFLIPGDAEGYWMLGGKIASGEEYAIYDPPRQVLRMPGFPALLAGTRFLFDDSFLATRVVLGDCRHSGLRCGVSSRCNARCSTNGTDRRSHRRVLAGARLDLVCSCSARRCSPCCLR